MPFEPCNTLPSVSRVFSGRSMPTFVYFQHGRGAARREKAPPKWIHPRGHPRPTAFFFSPTCGNAPHKERLLQVGDAQGARSHEFEQSDTGAQPGEIILWWYTGGAYANRSEKWVIKKFRTLDWLCSSSRSRPSGERSMVGPSTIARLLILIRFFSTLSWTL